MLHQQTVEGRTFDLLVELSANARLKDFFLVGGTALSLQLGHRKSIDLDLFTRKSFDPHTVLENLKRDYPSREIMLKTQFPNTLMVTMDKIKVDFIQHDYPLLYALREPDNLRLASIDDIAAMKVNAMVQSGERMKDFVDMAEIAKHRTIAQVMDAYQKKYANGIPVPFARKAVSYFEDVDVTERPLMMNGKLDWTATKKQLSAFSDGKDLRRGLFETPALPTGQTPIERRKQKKGRSH